MVTKRVVLFIALITLTASACLKVDMRIDVADDGSADLSGIVAVDAEAILELAEQFGDDSFGGRDQLCSEFAADQGFDDADPNLSTRPYEEDGFCGVEFEGTLSADQVSSGGGPLGDNSMILEPRGDGWYFEMTLSEEALGTGELEGMEDLLDMDDLFGDAEYVIRVRLPGRQVEHNGDFIEDDGTVGWDINLLNPPSSIFLRTEPGEPETGGGLGGDDDGGGNTGVVIGIVIVVLVAVAIVAFLLLRNRDRGDRAAGGTDGPATSTPVAPTGPPTSGEPDGGPPSAPDPGSGPTPEEATGQPVWDPGRQRYVQWDPNGRAWLVFDDASQEWRRETP